ncbi:MAG TPA: hypothetical protein DEA08_22045, partial [Planctomycetes bacterium]|nr:hypothetical protein [Planctomycetota bacterium]
AESFSFGVEPGAEPGEGKAASLGVGRIPLGPAAASRVLLRSLARKRLLRDEEPRALLIANPDPRGDGGLPLAETVARVSGRELRNRRVQVAEFYGRASDDPRVRAAATSAHLVVYEGHINDQRLIRSPADELEGEGEEWFLEGEPRNVLGEPIEDTPTPEPQPPAPAPTPGGEGLPPLDRLLPQEDEPWLGQPVLVLQSCNSLDEELLARLVARGGAGLIGSVTRIHSASGSSYLHALIHGLLERGHTLGEALRDAKNYFLLLSDLKAQRGHREQSKTLRVGLSFRLWGDPELRVFPSRRAPRRPAVAASLGEGSVKLAFPQRRLVSLRNRGFAVRTFPGSELAGIVRKGKQSGARRILPVHFHRLKAPRGFRERGYTRLVAPDAKKPACAWRLDEQRRALYVLYFPGAEPAGEEVELRFEK